MIKISAVPVRGAINGAAIVLSGGVRFLHFTLNSWKTAYTALLNIFSVSVTVIFRSNALQMFRIKR